VVVTIGGSTPADVYTNHANYTGSGGNASTTGTFSGLVNNPQPLSSAPAFDDLPPPATLATTSGTTSTNVKSPTLSTTSGTTSTNVKSQTLSSTKVTSSGNVVDSGLKTTSGKATGAVMNVSDSGQLLSLLDGAAPGPGGKITIPGSKATSNLKNSSRMNAADRLNAAGRLNADRRAADIRDARPLLTARLR